MEGQKILQALAEEAPCGTEEEKNISDLYKQKSREYLVQSRQCLIEAMIQEKEQDETADKETQPLCFTSLLTNENAELRIRAFYSLFSRKHDNAIEESIAQQQWSIEERLQELNASLPQGFKTSQERMDAINRGMNRLGLSLYPQKEPFERFKDELPKDEDDQVAEIMAQAKDEVEFEKKFGSKTRSDIHQDEEDEGSDEEDSDYEEEEEDAFLDDELLAIKTIRRKVVKAQAKLAELVALLDEAKTQKVAEDEENDLGGGEEDDSENFVENGGPATFLASGKKILRSAQRDLKKASMEWTESLF